LFDFVAPIFQRIPKKAAFGATWGYKLALITLRSPITAPIYSSGAMRRQFRAERGFRTICNGEREEDSEQFFVQREESKPLRSRQPAQPGNPSFSSQLIEHDPGVTRRL